MKFSKREDVEASIDAVFRAVSDFPAFERAALRRGVEVSRRDEMETIGPGMSWAARAPIRGRLRDVAIRVADWQPDTSLTLSADSSGVLGTLQVELVALSRQRTRMLVALELRAATMGSKLLLQSMKLTKGSLDKRFARRIADFAAEIAARQHRPGK